LTVSLNYCSSILCFVLFENCARKTPRMWTSS
jgi:hypothetical protein